MLQYSGYEYQTGKKLKSLEDPAIVHVIREQLAIEQLAIGKPVIEQSEMEKLVIEQPEMERLLIDQGVIENLVIKQLL